MGLYNKKGLYSGYKKNHTEREALDYYATPPEEVTNILTILGEDMNEKTILEPCVGGGHMLQGIEDYLNKNNQKAIFFISDVVNRNNWKESFWSIFGDRADFLSDDYPFSDVDYVIMNPPFATIEPFVIRGLEIAKEKLILFGRLQFLEGQGRYTNIFKNNPPNDIYVYVDRVKCGKNGDFPNTSSVQAYAWYIWDKKERIDNSRLHWIRRI